MAGEQVTFSFGENWRDFASRIGEREVESAISDLVGWLGPDGVRDRSCVDVGCGSGLSSLALARLGAARVLSFDLDPVSVSTTRALRERYLDEVAPAERAAWTVAEGSVLDDSFVASLGRFDLVYSWGVLHHTGEMWRACENAVSLLAPRGTLFIALYAKTAEARYQRDLALKRRFNRASPFGKRVIIHREILRKMAKRMRHLRNPLAWDERKERGMDTLHGIVDWLGGLPYEVASEEEVAAFAREHGLSLVRSRIRRDGRCSVFLLQREAGEGSR